MMNPPFAIIQTDVSKIQAGDWFLPMTIKEVNQHSLIAEAVKKGAIGFTYQENEKIASFDVPHFSVPDLRKYLFNLAIQHRPSLQAQVAVITGSNGKTSVKELLGAILQASHPQTSFISPANLNTKIALANQILRLPNTCAIAGFEMGARRVGDFAIPLSYLQPSVVALLNIGTAHVGEFGSKEKLAQEKMSGLDAASARTLIVPYEDAMILEKARSTGKRVITFGYVTESEIQILPSRSASEVILKIAGQVRTLHCPFSASAKELNVAAAVGIAVALDIPVAKIHEGLASFKGVARRFQAFDWNGTYAIDDAFNASPESMLLGLQEFAKLAQGKRTLLVLGSMLELGLSCEEEHIKIGREITSLFHGSPVRVATVGTEAQAIVQGLNSSFQTFKFADAQEARSTLKEMQSHFDMAFFKGSKSIQLHKIFQED
ncbi:UDP-N-acetylmuramoyl-tripeptide--D-alanyl-D-alanine ligase [Bdellovibrio sp. NC01]|uniref:Mur ligase family protein n=1 Tax=Bdellovibrio sp. NC01 TaxID=2220073 RepID=UPI0011574D6F|nr:UDP-N-acetylmuramoyl-tripeptide--D-alanyl-D-alanine ligase [Bdellovibrio sp. NC01]QDK38009.1 hypothetical protein DOE51_10625 [Bdellovibrio sp. NC01]